jgi:hypothetical protein
LLGPIGEAKGGTKQQQTKEIDMARGNGRTINVKLPTAKVIVALQQALAKLELDYASQDQAEAEYQKATEKWKIDIQKWALDNFSKAENIRTNYRQWTNNLNVDFDIPTTEGKFPEEPMRNFESMNIHSYRDMKEEIANAIRILQLTDEETVSTSTYNSIARYL